MVGCNSIGQAARDPVEQAPFSGCEYAAVLADMVTRIGHIGVQPVMRKATAAWLRWGAEELWS